MSMRFELSIMSRWAVEEAAKNLENFHTRNFDPQKIKCSQLKHS